MKILTNRLIKNSFLISHISHPQGDTADAITFGIEVGAEMLTFVPSASWPCNDIDMKQLESQIK